MGVDKLFLPLGDSPILAHVLRAVGGAEPDEIWVVTRRQSAERVEQTLRRESVRTIVNVRADEGMGTSIACAAMALGSDAEAMLLAQGDQPLVPAIVYRSMVERFRRERPSFLAARYGDLVTTPVVFASPLFAELAALSGDRGARSVLDRHRPNGAFHDLPEDVGIDADDPESYRRIVEIHERTAG